MSQYKIGSDVIGADPVYYGPVSPQQLAEAKRPLTAEEKKAADEWKGTHPTWLQREAFGGIKNWQAVAGGGGLAAIITGVIVLVVRRR